MIRDVQRKVTASDVAARAGVAADVHQDLDTVP